MNIAPSSNREGLLAHTHLLKVLKRNLKKDSPQMVDSIRRVSRSIRNLGDHSYLSDIEPLISSLEKATPQDMPKHLEELLDKLSYLSMSGHPAKEKILIVDDDPVTTEIISKNLAAANRHIIRAVNTAQAETILRKHEISIVILDLGLPDFDGRNLLVRLRSHPVTAEIPVIVLSAKNEPYHKAECFALGADGFFEKPIDPNILTVAVASKMQQSLRNKWRSRLDPLTGLPNRSAFLDVFKREARLALRSHEPLALAILDIDRFKSINDLFGHEKGDEVLKRVTVVITNSLRSTDFLARWGGEEFVILFPHTDLAKAHVALEKALESLRNEPFQAKDGKPFQVTFSAGIVRVRSFDSLESKIAGADHFLLQAKASGRNRIFSEKNQTQGIKKTVLLVDDDLVTANLVRRHLQRDGFEVLYAREAKAALQMAIQERPCLMILDIRMEGMDGYELLVQLRQVPSLRHVPIAFFTQVDRQNDIARGFQLGADEYILKPFTPIEFLARIHRLVRN